MIPSAPLSFVKMHGLGNDFILLWDPPMEISPPLVQKMAHRRKGIGCDQLLVIHEKVSPSPSTLTIWNADGSLAEACGNGMRCAFWWLAQKKNAPRQVFFLETPAGLLEGRITAPFEVEATQGTPLWPFGDEPFDLSPWHLPPGFAVNLGNPHLVVFIPHLQDIPLEVLGPLLENHSAFPQRTNVEFVEVAADHLKVRVWERGTGITPACGSGACAAATVALRHGHQKGPLVFVQLEGGVLQVTSAPGQPLRQKGPISFSFEGLWFGASA